ncbi:TIGR02391 family protein [archaeon]|nr:TIGR02391 family protein [archaeon]
MKDVKFSHSSFGYEGDKIRITRGYRTSDSGVDAYEIENLTRGGKYIGGGGGRYQSGSQLRDPLEGFVKNLESRPNHSTFQLVDHAVPAIGLALNTIQPLLDEELYRRVFGKTYDDTAFNALKVVEERIRARIGDKEGLTGNSLIDEAFHKDSGKLILADLDNERLSVYLLFKGANGIFRNPVAHRYIDDEEIAAFEIVCFANRLISLIEKAELRVS